MPRPLPKNRLPEAFAIQSAIHAESNQIEALSFNFDNNTKESSKAIGEKRCALQIVGYKNDDFKCQHFSVE